MKHTGYGRAVRIAIERLYGVSDFNEHTMGKVAEQYHRWVKPGFYATILRDHAGIESCQVNSLETPFVESKQPTLLLQDLSILYFSVCSGSNWTSLADGDGRREPPILPAGMGPSTVSQNKAAMP